MPYSPLFHKYAYSRWKMTMKKDFLLFVFPLFLSPFTASLCQFLFSFPLCVSTFLHFHPFLFPRECTSRAGECIRYPFLHSSPPDSVYFPHARSHMGFNYELMPGKCKARAHACTAEPCPPRPVSAAIWICFLSCKLRKRNRERWLSCDPAGCYGLTDTWWPLV